MNSYDKVTSSRTGRASKAALVRHARKCLICKHPEREAIEEEFVHWLHADDIVDDHDLPSRTNLYRHAHATGLYEVRRRNMRYALEHVIEDATHAAVSGDCVIRAIRAYSRITEDGRWVEPPQRLVVSRDDAALDAVALPGNSGDTNAFPEQSSIQRALPNPTGETQEGPGLEAASDLVSGSLTLNLPELPKARAITDFLIDTPKRLEIAVTPTEQTTELISNRNKIGPLSEDTGGQLG